MSKSALRTCNELATDFFNREFVAEILNSSKLSPYSRLTYELQELTTNYKIQLRTSRIGQDLASNPKMYQFAAIRRTFGS